jgi:hypothetical protein
MHPTWGLALNKHEIALEVPFGFQERGRQVLQSLNPVEVEGILE